MTGAYGMWSKRKVHLFEKSGVALAFIAAALVLGTKGLVQGGMWGGTALAAMLVLGALTVFLLVQSWWK